MNSKHRKITLKAWIDGLGTDQVAKLLKCDRSAVCHWRRGICLPTTQKIAQILKFSKGAIDFNAEIEAFHQKRVG